MPLLRTRMLSRKISWMKGLWVPFMHGAPTRMPVRIPTHVHSLPCVDAVDAYTDNDGELPSDSSSLSSVRAGDAFSQVSSPPHLAGFSDIQMHGESDSPSLQPVQAVDAFSLGLSLPIGTALPEFETRGPFTASSFANIPSDWLNLDECEADPDSPENRGPGD